MVVSSGGIRMHSELLALGRRELALGYTGLDHVNHFYSKGSVSFLFSGLLFCLVFIFMFIFYFYIFILNPWWVRSICIELVAGFIVGGGGVVGSG